MKKMISVLLTLCIAGCFMPVSAAKLKDSDVIGEMEFKDPGGIYLSEDEQNMTLPLSDIAYIKAGSAIEPGDDDTDAAIFYDFYKEAANLSLRTVKFSFKDEVAVSGLRIWDDYNSVEKGEIYGSADGIAFVLLGRLNVNGGKKSVTDFGFNVKVKNISVVTEGKGNLTVSEIHIIKENKAFQTVDIASAGGALYYENEPEKWKISADTEYRLHPARDMFDGKTNTFWHSDYDDDTVESKKKLPHSVTVDFGENKLISGIRMTPRNGGSRITAADIYVSGDGRNFYKAGHRSFSYASADEKVIDFGENILTRAVKMVSVSTEGNTYSTCAELEFKKPDMSYFVSDKPDELTPALCGSLKAEVNGKEMPCLTDNRSGEHANVCAGDVLTVRTSSEAAVSGIRLKAADGRNVTDAKISVSTDGNIFFDFAEHSLLNGEYLFRCNIGVRAVRVYVKAAEEKTAEITEISLISECSAYNKIDIDKEIRNTGKFSVTADSENALSPASNLIDGDIYKIWHSYYDNMLGEKDTPPIDLVFDFGEAITISGFNYYPLRQNTDAEKAGNFKSLEVYAAADDSREPVWYLIAEDKYTYGGYYSVQTTEFDFNLKVRKLKITVTDGSYSYATAGEIRFLSSDPGKVPRSAKALNAFAEFEFDDFDDIESVMLPYAINDALFLTEFNVNGKPVDKGYYSASDDGVVLSKYFFTDFLPDRTACDITFELKFFRGESINYTVKVGGAERHRIFYESGSGGRVYAKAGGKEVSSGEEARRKDKLSLSAVPENGYRLKRAFARTVNQAYDYYDIDREKYTVTASSVYPQRSEKFMTDGDTSTYWHSGYTVENGAIVSSDKPPFEITADFKEKTDGVSKIRYVPRQDNDGGRIIAYKVYVSHDGSDFSSEPVAEGKLVNSDEEQCIAFNEPIDSVCAVKLEILSTSGGTYAQIAELNVVGAVKKEAKVSAGANGTKESVFYIDDLFADIEFYAEFEKIKEGTTRITYAFDRITKINAPDAAENGKDFSLTVKADDGYRLPENIKVYAGESMLSPSADYIYLVNGDEGLLTVKNPDGREIKISASGVSLKADRRVSYSDKLGASGALPDAMWVKQGEKFTLPSGKGLKLVGYIFDGWTLDGVKYKAGDTVTAQDKDMPFYASWKIDTSRKDESGDKDKPSVKPSGNTSSGKGAPGGYVPEKEKVYKVYLSGTGYVTYNNGDKVENPREIPGYKFDGWYMDEALTVPYSNTGVTGPLMLYPKYTKLQSEEPFEDIIGHWAYGDILYLYGKNVVKGTKEGGFSPDAYVTRAEFIMMLYNISGSDSDLQDVFKDVSKDDWFFKAAVWAYAAGITAGTDKESFSPYEKLSREQAVTMLARYMKLSDADDKEDGKEIFADYDEISDYAKNAVGTAVREGIVLGRTDHKFAPLENTTRAECAVILGRVVRKS